MKPLLFSHMRTGLMVLGLFAGLSPAMAAPATIAQPLPLDGPQTAGTGVVNQDNAPMRVAERRGFRPNGGRGGWNRPPHGGGGNWNRPPHGGGGNWHRPPNRGHWNHRPRRNWNNNYWGWGPGYWGGLYGSGIYLQFGQPYYPYGNPGPVYRSDIRLSAAHVQWCYDRWRSYRASDNSYQPYNGPRRLCISPYS